MRKAVIRVRPLERWLARLARHEARAIYLSDALLGGRLWGYTWYRLRWFALTLLALFCVHTAEFWLLYQVFFQRALVGVVVLRNATSLFNGFFFGAMDDLRQRLPSLVVEQDRARFQREIDGWFSLSIFFSACTVLLAAGYVLYDLLWGVGIWRVFHLYWIACLLRLALELPIRALHSVVFGLRRVYRPFFSFMVMDGLGLLVVLLLYPWIHLWSFSVALIIASPVAAGIALYYIRRAYAETRLPRPHFRWRLVLGPFTRPRQLAEPLGAGVSHVTMRLASFLVVALGFLDSEEHPSLLPLILLIHLFGPLINASVSWIYLFYYDMKKLAALVTQRMLDRLLRHLGAVSWVIGGMLWLSGAAMVSIFAGPKYTPHLLLLAPVFLLRTRLAVLYMTLFATRRYHLLTACSLLLVIMIYALLAKLPGEEQILPLLIAIVFLAFLAAAAAVRWSRPRPPLGKLCSFHEWREVLSRWRGPQRISVALLSRDAPSARKVARAFCAACGRLQVAVLDARRIAWAHSSAIDGVALPGGRNSGGDEDARAVVDEETRAVVALGGLAVRVDSTGAAPSGPDALLAAGTRGLLGPDCALPHGKARLESLLAEFRLQFPEGHCLDMKGPPPPPIRALTSDERQQVLLAALAFCQNRRSVRSRRLSFDVSAFCPSGPLEAIFLTPRSSDAERRASWRRLLRQNNLSNWLSVEP